MERLVFAFLGIGFPWVASLEEQTSDLCKSQVVQYESIENHKLGILPRIEEANVRGPPYSFSQLLATDPSENNGDDDNLHTGLRPRRVNPYPLPKRIDIGHIEGKGIGYEKGYTKLGVIFGPEYRVDHFLPLVDVRGVVFDNGSMAGNVGFIGRFLPKSMCEIFGINLFYDYRQGEMGGMHQVSGGFEILSKRWELHANAYIPLGKGGHTRKCVFDDYIGDYRATRSRHEFAEYASDANVGYYVVNSKNFQLYAAAGPYFLFGKLESSAWGGKAMLRPQYRDYLAVELSVSHDRIFETIYQVNVIFTIPLYNYSSALKNKKGPCKIPNRQIYQPIDRDVIIMEKCCWKFNW